MLIPRPETEWLVELALSRLLPAGFYYKTFMWPGSPRAWLFYEHWIRRAAGMGRAAAAPGSPSTTTPL